MKYRHEKLHDTSKEAQENRIICVSVRDLLVSHQRHEGRRTYCYVFATAEDCVDETTHKGRI